MPWNLLEPFRNIFIFFLLLILSKLQEKRMIKMEYIVKILMTEFVTRDVKRFILEKPLGFKFIPGQAVDISINLPEWKEKTNPFTFTSSNDDLVLEFTIKKYLVSEFPQHTGVTEKLHSLKPGDELIIGEIFGTINYKGKGVFIAGGAGITPFIAILRDLKKKNEIDGNTLIFSNKTQKDIILEGEFREMFSQKNLILTLTEEKVKGYEDKMIDMKFLKKKISNFKQNFYICGPNPFVKAIRGYLKELGADVSEVVFER